jgi:hypothetical protein
MAADAQLASSCSSSSSSASSSSLDATDAGGSSSSSFPAYLAGETARRAAISARFSRDRMRLTPLPPSTAPSAAEMRQVVQEFDEARRAATAKRVKVYTDRLAAVLGGPTDFAALARIVAELDAATRGPDDRSDSDR